MSYHIENEFFEFLRDENELLKLLLFDFSTNQNIVWATDSYFKYGESYGSNRIITIEALRSKKPLLIQPRVSKSKREQQVRSKNSAEVFTPSWVCNNQINLIDESWFGYSNVFNVVNENKWTRSLKKVIFPEGKSWKDYILDIRLEISCGEAPYITSRYDAVSGEFIELKNRIGILDRKIRLINENSDKEYWLKNVISAYKSVYAYDLQGDNILVARSNLLLTFIENYYDKFNQKPDNKLLHEIATIISWNVWQMDGIKYVVPDSCKDDIKIDSNLFGEKNEIVYQCPGCIREDYNLHNGVYCKIMDWDKGKSIRFLDVFLREGLNEFINANFSTVA